MKEETEGWQRPLCTSILVLRDRFRRAHATFERFTKRIPPEKATFQQRRMAEQIGAEFNAGFLGALLTTAAAVESLVNFFLAKRMLPAEFEKIERRPTVEKWTKHVLAIVPGYTVPDAILVPLVSLFDARNDLMHGKTRITRDGVVTHTGSVKMTPTAELEAWMQLPWLLTHNVALHDLEAQFEFNLHMPGWKP